ncbi:uncharacterized protein LOC106716622 [Papilio machaon]|uniref:uncharacterized protein LOC106716622 n=1 Tax=Papilio machaon TaxID=76193 RepID=UPI001E663134|nr:uncharacterized protein LOC106716622 [Papilio machaon]
MLCGKHFDVSSFTGIDRKKLNNFAIPTEAQHILTELRIEMMKSSPDKPITHEDQEAPSCIPQSESMELTIECTPWPQNLDKTVDSTMSSDEPDEEFEFSVQQKLTANSSNRSGGNELNLDSFPKIPQFSGKFWDWPLFKDNYISLIHSSKLDNINKFKCLISAVKGNALRMIKKIEFTAENYEIAWQLLLYKYDNNRCRVNNLLNELLNFPIIKKESSRDLKSLVDNIKTSLCALKSLGQPTDYWDTIVIHLMVRKLDSVTFREWENQCNALTTSPNLKQFLEFISNKADTLEIIYKEDKRKTRKKMRLLRENISPN